MIALFGILYPGHLYGEQATGDNEPEKKQDGAASFQPYRRGPLGEESSERLGRFRWVVEHTLSWLNRFRRLKVRYERRADIHQAFLTLGCALICHNALTP
jgi:hypothetical protein